jgi:hypothetical protein
VCVSLPKYAVAVRLSEPGSLDSELSSVGFFSTLRDLNSKLLNVLDKTKAKGTDPRV